MSKVKKEGVEGMFKYNTGDLVRFKHSGEGVKYVVVQRTLFDSGQGFIILYELRVIHNYVVGDNLLKAHEHELELYVEPKKEKSSKKKESIVEEKKND